METWNLPFFFLTGLCLRIPDNLFSERFNLKFPTGKGKKPRPFLRLYLAFYYVIRILVSPHLANVPFPPPVNRCLNNYCLTPLLQELTMSMASSTKILHLAVEKLTSRRFFQTFVLETNQINNCQQKQCPWREWCKRCAMIYPQFKFKVWYVILSGFIFYSDFSPILVPLQSAMTVTLPSGAGSHHDHNPFPGSLACIVGFEDTVSNA